MLANSGQIMTSNKGNLFVFEVGPSVTFVSAIKDAMFNKNIGVNFFVKKAKPGGLVKYHTFYGVFFRQPSL